MAKLETSNQKVGNFSSFTPKDTSNTTLTPTERVIQQGTYNQNQINDYRTGRDTSIFGTRTYAANMNTGEVVASGGNTPYIKARDYLETSKFGQSKDWGTDFLADTARAALNGLNTLEQVPTAIKATVWDATTNENSSDYKKSMVNETAFNFQAGQTQMANYADQFKEGHSAIGKLTLGAIQESSRQILSRAFWGAPASFLTTGGLGAIESYVLPGMFLEVAPSAYVNGRLGGATKGTAFTMAGFRGGIEVLTESMGGMGFGYRGKGIIDSYWDTANAYLTKTLKSKLAADLAVAFTSEGTEEIMSNVLNVVTDATVGKLLANGGWQNEFESFEDFMKDSIEAFFTAGISAGFSGMVHGIPSYANQNNFYHQMGLSDAQIRTMIMEDAAEELRIAGEMKNMTKEQKVAYSYIMKAAGKDTGRSAPDIMKIVTQMKDEELKPYMEKKTARQAAEKKLEELRNLDAKNHARAFSDGTEVAEESPEIIQAKEDIKEALKEEREAEAKLGPIMAYFTAAAKDNFEEHARLKIQEAAAMAMDGSEIEMNLAAAVQQMNELENVRSIIIDNKKTSEIKHIDALLKSRNLGSALEYVNNLIDKLAADIETYSSEIEARKSSQQALENEEEINESNDKDSERLPVDRVGKLTASTGNSEKAQNRKGETRQQEEVNLESSNEYSQYKVENGKITYTLNDADIEATADALVNGDIEYDDLISGEIFGVSEEFDEMPRDLSQIIRQLVKSVESKGYYFKEANGPKGLTFEVVESHNENNATEMTFEEAVKLCDSIKTKGHYKDISREDFLGLIKNGIIMVDAKGTPGYIYDSDFVVNTEEYDKISQIAEKYKTSVVIVKNDALIRDKNGNPIIAENEPLSIGKLVGGINYRCLNGSVCVIAENDIDFLATTLEHELGHASIKIELYSAPVNQCKYSIFSIIKSIVGNKYHDETIDYFVEEYISSMKYMYPKFTESQAIHVALDEILADSITPNKVYLSRTLEDLYEKRDSLSEETKKLCTELITKLKEPIDLRKSGADKWFLNYDSYMSMTGEINEVVNQAKKKFDATYEEAAITLSEENSEDFDVVKEAVKDSFEEHVNSFSDNAKILVSMFDQYRKPVNTREDAEAALVEFLQSGESFKYNGELVNLSAMDDKAIQELIDAIDEALEAQFITPFSPPLRKDNTNHVLTKLYASHQTDAVRNGTERDGVCRIDDILDGTAKLCGDGFYHLEGGQLLDPALAKAAASAIRYDARTEKYKIMRRTGSEMRLDNKDFEELRFDSKTTAFAAFCNLKHIYQRPFFNVMDSRNSFTPFDRNAGNPIYVDFIRNKVGTNIAKDPFEYIRNSYWNQDSLGYVPSKNGDDISENYIIQTTSAINDEVAWAAYKTMKQTPELVPNRFKNSKGEVDYNKFNNYVDETISIMKFQSPTELSNFVQRHMSKGVYIGGQLYSIYSITDSDLKNNKIRLMRNNEFQQVRALYDEAGVSIWDEALFFNPAKAWANQGKDNSPSYRQNLVDARKCVVLKDVEKEVLLQHAFVVTDPVSGNPKSIDNYQEVWNQMTDEQKNTVIKRLENQRGEKVKLDKNGVPEFQVGDSLIMNSYALNMTDGAALYELQGSEKGMLGKVQFRGEVAHCMKGIMHEMPIMSMLVDSGLTELTDFWGHKIKIVETDESGKPVKNSDGSYKLLKNGILFESTVKMIKAEKYKEGAVNSKGEVTNRQAVFGAMNADELTPQQRKNGLISFTESLKDVHTLTNERKAGTNEPVFGKEYNYGIRFMERGETFAFNSVEQGEEVDDVESFTQVLRAMLMDRLSEPEVENVPVANLIERAVSSMEKAIDGTNDQALRNLLGANVNSRQINDVLAALADEEYFKTSYADKEVRKACKDILEGIAGCKMPLKANVVNATIFPDLIAVAQGVTAMQTGGDVNSVKGVLKQGEISNPKLRTSKLSIGGNSLNKAAVMRSPTQQLSDQNVMIAVDINGKGSGNYFYTTDMKTYLTNRFAIMQDGDVMYHNVNDLLMLRLDADVDGDHARIIQDNVLVNALNDYLSYANSEEMKVNGDYNIIEFKHGKAPSTYCTVENLVASIRNSLSGDSIGISDKFLTAVYNDPKLSTEAKYKMAAMFSVAYKLSTDVFKTGYYPKAWSDFMQKSKALVGYKRFINPPFVEKVGGEDFQSAPEKLHGEKQLIGPNNPNIGKKTFEIDDTYSPDSKLYQSPRSEKTYLRSVERSENFKKVLEVYKNKGKGELPRVKLPNGRTSRDVYKESDKYEFAKEYLRTHPETDEMGRTLLSQFDGNPTWTYSEVVKAILGNNYGSKVKTYDKHRPSDFVGRTHYKLSQKDNKWYSGVNAASSKEFAQNFAAKMTGFKAKEDYLRYIKYKANNNEEIARSFNTATVMLGRALGRFNRTGDEEYIENVISPLIKNIAKTFTKYGFTAEDLINSTIFNSFILDSYSNNSTIEEEYKKQGFKKDYDYNISLDKKAFPVFRDVGSLFIETIKQNLGAENNGEDLAVKLVTNAFESNLEGATDNIGAFNFSPPVNEEAEYTSKGFGNDIGPFKHSNNVVYDEYEDLMQSYENESDAPKSKYYPDFKYNTTIDEATKIVEENSATEAPSIEVQAAQNTTQETNAPNGPTVVSSNGTVVDTTKNISERRTESPINKKFMEKVFVYDDNIKTFKFKDRDVTAFSSNKLFKKRIDANEYSTLKHEKINGSLVKVGDDYVPANLTIEKDYGMFNTATDCRNNPLRYTWFNADVMTTEELRDALDTCRQFLSELPEQFKDTEANDFLNSAMNLFKTVKGNDDITKLREVQILTRKAADRWEHETDAKQMAIEMQRVFDQELNGVKFDHEFIRTVKKLGIDKATELAGKAVETGNKLKWETTNMQCVFKALSAYKRGGLGYSLAKQLNMCGMQKDKYMAMCNSYFNKETLERFNNASDEVKNGTTMFMYLMMATDMGRIKFKFEDGAKHNVFDNGLVIDNNGTYLTDKYGNKLAGEDLYKYMEEQSKYRDKQFCKEWFAFAKDIAPLAQQAYYNATGIQISGEAGWRENYFPVFMASKGRVQGTDTQGIECFTRFFNTNHINQRDNAMLLQPANRIAQAYVDQMCTYMAYAEYDQMMINLFGGKLAPEAPNRDIAAALHDTYGDNGPFEILQRYARQLNGVDKKERSTTDALLGNLMLNLQTSAIPLNPKVWVTQIASVEIAQYWGLDNKKLIKNLTKNLKKCSLAQENVDKLIEEIPESIRFMFETRWANQQIDPNYLQSYQGTDTIAGKATNAIGNVTNKVAKKLTGHQFKANIQVNVMDMCTVMAKEQTMREKWISEGKDVNSNAYAMAVYEMIREGDPANDRHMRSDLQRSESNYKKATWGMFRSQPEQNQSLTFTASMERRANDTKATRANEARAYKAVLSSQFFFVAIGVAWSLAMGKGNYKDEDGNIDPIKLIYSLGMQTLAQGNDPFLQPIKTALISTLDDNVYAGEYGISTLDNLNKASDAIIKFINNPSATSGKQAALKISAVMGLPLSTAYDIVNAVCKTTITDGTDVTKYLDKTIKENKAKGDTSDPAAWVKANKSILDTDGNGHVKAAEVEAYANENPDYQDVLREYWNSKYKSKCPF